MTEKSASKGARPTAERPKDLSHIRVGPPFEAKRGGRCASCHDPVKGKEAHVVENTKTEAKKVICADCLAKDPELAARQDADDLNSFLA